jgi:hypothetical protein
MRVLVLAAFSVFLCACTKEVSTDQMTDQELIELASLHASDCQDPVIGDPKIIKGNDVTGVYYETSNPKTLCVVYIEKSGTIEVDITETPRHQ